jgi:hypothetical protein
MFSIATSSPATSLISPSAIVFTSIPWPLVLLSESPRSEIRGFPALVFLPETRTLITCHFYVRTKIEKKISKERGKETKINYYIQTSH